MERIKKATPNPACDFLAEKIFALLRDGQDANHRRWEIRAISV
jgi:hypothetical protein